MRKAIVTASFLALSILVGLGMILSSQPNDGQKTLVDRVTVPLSKPGQPMTLKVNGPEIGNVKVIGTDGQEVIIETYAREESSSERTREPKRKTEGLRLVKSGSSRLGIGEENNVVWVDFGRAADISDITIKVPRQCSLTAGTVDGDILVENISGDLEAKSSDGDVVLTGVSGSVIASTADGDVTVVLNSVTPGMPMSFSTVEGDVDVTLPADVKATVRLKTEEGDFYTDFAIDLQKVLEKKESGRPQEPAGRPGRTPVERDAVRGGHAYRLDLERVMKGAINGGGPEYKFYSMEGDIYLRKKK